MKLLEALCGLTMAATFWASSAMAAPLGSAMPGDGFDTPDFYAKPMNPAATAKTIATFRYLASLTRRTTSNIVEGQHLGGPSDADDPAAFDLHSHAILPGGIQPRSAYPRIVGARYDAKDAGGKYVLDDEHNDKINQFLINAANEYNAIIAITATPLNPWDHTKGRTPSADHPPSISRLFRANKDSDPVAADFWQGIDTIGRALGKLKTADGELIPVLFRPFAEFNTDKYYFVEQNPQDFVRLWNEVRQYYLADLKLNNLIFCWEAWVWHRNKEEQVNIAPWWPGDTSVDIVAGAFYFKAADTDYYTLNIPVGSNDYNVFYSLTNQAVSKNKPFGATQWGMGQDTDAINDGDGLNALAFMTSMDAKHYDENQPVGKKVQHLAFMYYWTVDMAVEAQDHAADFVNDPRVASVAGFKSIGLQDGYVLESQAGSGVGGNTVVSGSSGNNALRTGDSGGSTCANCQYRSIVSFDTASVPAQANIFSAILRIKKGSAFGVGNPFAALGPLNVDVADITRGYIGSTENLGSDDFKNNFNGSANVLAAARMSDPSQGNSGWSFGALNAAGLSSIYRSGKTQLRLRFQTPSDGNGYDNYMGWYSGETVGNEPELILNYSNP